MSRAERRNFLKGMAFLSPWLLGFMLFMLPPIGLLLYYSFCDYTVIQKPVFCGWDNYRWMAHDMAFVQVLRNSLIYAALALPLGLVVSLATALLLNFRIVGQGIFRTIVFLPSLVPAVAAALLWTQLYDPKYGVLDAALAGLGIRDGPNWIGSATWVIPSLVFMSLWGIGNTVIIYLAGLQDVPRELYEAADLDGAGPIRRLFHVTLPMLSPVIFYNLIMAIIGVMQVYDVPVVMTGGGPNRASTFLTQYVYDNAFTSLRMGYASAIAWVQLLLILAVTAIAFVSSRYWVHYQVKR